jgi:hypothetical protein
VIVDSVGEVVTRKLKWRSPRSMPLMIGVGRPPSDTDEGDRVTNNDQVGCSISSAAARLTLPETVPARRWRKNAAHMGVRAARASGRRGARRLRGLDDPGHMEGLPPNAAARPVLERVGKVIIARVYDRVQGPAGGS